MDTCNRAFPQLQLLLRDAIHPPQKWIRARLLRAERAREQRQKHRFHINSARFRE
jgi:hypothetical protein